MLYIREEHEMNPETGDVTGTGQFWLCDGETLVTEVFWLTPEDSDESMRLDGYVPVEEQYPGVEIPPELGETVFYVQI